MKRNILLILTSILSLGLLSQENMVVPKIDATIILDGYPDEEVWNQLSSFDFTMQSPVHRGQILEETDVRMFFNDDYLFVGSRLYYTEISKMSAAGKQRDFMSMATDWLGVFLDTYHDKQNSMVFFTNPNGLRWDATVKNDMADAEHDMNLTWNTFWDVESRYDDKCWYSEMRIPISSLRFQDTDGKVIMGLTLMRFIPETNETYLFPDIVPDEANASLKPSRSATVEFNEMKTKKPLYITPYLLGGYTGTNELSEDESRYDLVNDYVLEPGLDIKYGLTSNLTLDVTVNTDFAQVEADDQQINLSRFSLFFPEKRVFFQEKSDIFDFNLGARNTLFYSRRIGLHEGEQVRIWGGARLTGRAGNWDLGLLDMQAAETGELPSENHGVLRIKRRVFNDYSYLGSMITSRLGTDGSYNLAYGLDAHVRIFGNDYLTTRWAQTFEDGVVTDNSFVDHSDVLVVWERRTQKGFAYNFQFGRSGTDYNPGLGFEMIDNARAFLPSIKYGWILENDNSKLRWHGFAQNMMLMHSTEDGSLITLQSKTDWEFETRNAMSGTVSALWNRENVTDTLDFEQAEVPPGSYDSFSSMLMIMTPPGGTINNIISAEAGQFYDGSKISLMWMPNMNISPSINISGTYRFDHVNFNKRDQKFTNHIIGLKGLLMFSTKLSVSSFIQYNTAVDAFVINGRFRYNPREGNDFYIVYNEGLNTDIYREVPTMPRSDSRTILLKYTYTFGF